MLRNCVEIFLYRGRLKHGRHFTFKSAAGDVAITLVTPSVEGSFADNKHPYAAHGPWLHILVEEDFLDKLITDLAELAKIDKVRRVSLLKHVTSVYITGGSSQEI